MKLVVYLEPDYAANETLGDSVTNINEAGKVAIEVALQEQDKGESKVTALIFGAESDETILREAYAMGVDELIQVTNKEDSAAAVVDFVKANGYEAVITAAPNAGEVAQGLGFELSDAVKMNAVVQIKGTEAKPRYMHIARVFAAYEQQVKNA